MTDATLTLTYMDGEFRSRYKGHPDPEKIYVEYADAATDDTANNGLCACRKPEISEEVVTMTVRCDLCGAEEKKAPR